MNVPISNKTGFKNRQSSPVVMEEFLDVLSQFLRSRQSCVVVGVEEALHVVACVLNAGGGGAVDLGMIINCS